MTIDNNNVMFLFNSVRYFESQGILRQCIHKLTMKIYEYCLKTLLTIRHNPVKGYLQATVTSV